MSFGGKFWNLNYRQTLCFVVYGIVFSSILAGSVWAGDDERIAWKPISPAELAMRSPIVESDADAEAIFWDTWIDDRSEGLKLNNYVRVKIFTDRGRDKYSKFDIPF